METKQGELAAVSPRAAKEVAAPGVKADLPPGWVATLHYEAFMTPQDIAHARLLELSGHLDFWNEEPDLYSE